MRSSFLFLLIIFCSSFFWQEERNQRCPVIPTEQTLSQYNTVYKGRLIFFCCENCVREFQSDPDFFLNRLPPIETEGTRSLDWNQYFLPLVLVGLGLLVVLRANLTRFPLGVSLPLAVALFSTSFYFLALCSFDVFGIREVAWTTRALWTFFIGFFFFSMIFGAKKVLSGSWLTLAVFLSLGIVGSQFWDRIFPPSPVQQQRDEYLNTLKVETIDVYGFPPEPVNATKQRSVRRSYYRGNDERHPKLFNGGNYRTATIHLSLCDGSGKTLEYGDQIQGSEIFLCLDIERAPNANKLFFQDELISQYFLTSQGEVFRDEKSPLTDRVGLEVEESMQRWRGKYPLVKLFANQSTDVEELVYLCQETGIRGPNRTGARFHFGIHCELHLKEGRLDSQSDLWMGSLFINRQMREFNLPNAEWLSTEPIPTIPENKAVEDPTLLGLPQK